MANLDRLVDVQINLSTTGISKNSYSDLLFMVPHALTVGRTMVITSADELLDAGFIQPMRRTRLQLRASRKRRTSSKCTLAAKPLMP